MNEVSEEVISSPKIEKTNKLKLNLTEQADHPFFNFFEEIKQRRVKNVDAGEIILEALNQVPKSWWETKIEELTPLEFRVDVAMNDPQLRTKLAQFLKTEKPAPHLN